MQLNLTKILTPTSEEEMKEEKSIGKIYTVRLKDNQPLSERAHRIVKTQNTSQEIGN